MCMSLRHCININFYLLLVGLLCSGASFAQSNKISGVITDEQSGEPIPFANVFFANTRIGVSSDADGKFELRNFPNGSYDLTVAFVGYNTYQQNLEFSGSEYKLTIKLSIAETKLQEVIVKADTVGWAYNFRTFKRYFLGETRNSAKCRILNPRDIHLYFDPQTKVLVAHATKPLVIENLALGFNINYYLRKFELDYALGRFEVSGIPMFQDINPKSKSEKRSWERERMRAYSGSVMHFIRALGRDSLNQAGFRVHKLYRVPNRNRPSEEILRKEITKYQTRIKNGERVNVGKGDSLGYFLNLRAQPKIIDSLATEELNVSEIIKEPMRVTYQGLLRVDYIPEREEAGYARTYNRPSRKDQTSVLHFMAPTLKIFENGYYENIYDVFLEGYWSWSEKMADLLPLDYQPVSPKRK